jgi:hypothetical protein
MRTACVGRTHGRTDQRCDVKFFLAKSEPSTHGASRKYRHVRLKSGMRCITDRTDRMAAIILAALLALVLWIAAANAGTCRYYSDGPDSVTACEDGSVIVRHQNGRVERYGTPNAGFERYPGQPPTPAYPRRD